MENTEIISNMIDKIIAGNKVEAEQDFQSLISNKVSVAIDARKQEVANSIYSDNVESEESEESEDESTPS